MSRIDGALILKYESILPQFVGYISYKFLQTYIVYTPLGEIHQIRDVTSIDLSVGATTVKMQCYSVTGSLSQWYSVIVL